VVPAEDGSEEGTSSSQYNEDRRRSTRHVKINRCKLHALMPQNPIPVRRISYS
jgi:hypothetical protein